MAKVSVYNMEGKEVESIDLNDAVFGVEVNEHLVHMAVVQQLANNRQGTQKAKTRSEVSGGGRKPWRQKGTGHARQGSYFCFILISMETPAGISNLCKASTVLGVGAMISISLL